MNIILKVKIDIIDIFKKYQFKIKITKIIKDMYKKF